MLEDYVIYCGLTVTVDVAPQDILSFTLVTTNCRLKRQILQIMTNILKDQTCVFIRLRNIHAEILRKHVSVFDLRLNSKL